jgi:hypothetical protein
MRGGRRNLHKDELHNIDSSPDVITEIIQSSMRWAGSVSCIGGKRSADNYLVGVPVKNRKIWRPRNTSEKSVRMDLKETEHEDVDWMLLA